MTIEEVEDYCFERAKRFVLMARNFPEGSESYEAYKAKADAYADIFVKLDIALRGEY